MDDTKDTLPPSNMDGGPKKEQSSSDKPTDGASEPRGEKRKWEGHKNKRQQQGSKRHKGRDMGRQEYLYVLIATSIEHCAAHAHVSRHH